jgi:hypothetical protein
VAQAAPVCPSRGAGVLNAPGNLPVQWPARLAGQPATSAGCHKPVGTRPDPPPRGAKNGWRRCQYLPALITGEYAMLAHQGAVSRGSEDPHTCPLIGG